MLGHWEYKLEAPDLLADELTQFLTDQSANGWDFVTAVEAGNDASGRYLGRLIFRRQETNPTWDRQGL